MTTHQQPPSPSGQPTRPQQAAPTPVGPPSSATPLPSLRLGPDRRSLRLAALLLIVGEAVSAVETLFHPADSDPIAEFVEYAGSRSWALIHSVQFAGAVIATFGVLALIHSLRVDSGIRGLVNRLAAASAVAVLALDGFLYAVDGVALKQAADAWVSAPPAAQPAFLAALEGVRAVEWGLRSYVDYTTGLSFVLLAIVIASTPRVPRAIGYLIGLTGLVHIALGVGWGSGDTAVADHSTVGIVGYAFQVLAWIWTIWLLVVACRATEPDDGTTPMARLPLG